MENKLFYYCVTNELMNSLRTRPLLLKITLTKALHLVAVVDGLTRQILFPYILKLHFIV